MNTKEIEASIKYLKGMEDGSVNQFDYCVKAIPIIISQLKRAEQLEKIWEESEGENFDLEKISVRPSVYLHARKMESRLREKDKEKGRDNWHDGAFPYYIERAMVCLSKITQKLRTGKDSKDYIGIMEADQLKVNDIHWLLKKCYDSSNFLMMLADNLRDELIKRGIKQNGKK